MLAHWRQHFQRSWLERGRPRSESSWPRLEIREKGRVIQACEYFVPELIGTPDGPQVSNYYKFIVLNADGEPLGLYKLEMSNLGQPFHVLAHIGDGSRRQVTRYGALKPDMWKVLKDVQADLAAPQK